MGGSSLTGGRVSLWKSASHFECGGLPQTVKAQRARQLDRIVLELTLRGHNHPNLIQILDGGACKTTGYLYIVMEFVDAPDLASVINQVPRDRIRPIIGQVADAARYLEERDIVHRDIKPDNIAISPDFSKATLLDLGVIRPLDVSKLTESSDGNRQSFLGTLRYSPPEYIFRTEQQDRDGYRAITFYQLGGVLYDLITKERLFEAFSLPKARLVKAVEQETPKIHQPDVPEDLIWLARNCLLKEPEHRLWSVQWQDFEPAVMESTSAARVRVMRRFASSLESSGVSPETKATTAWDIERAVRTVQQQLTALLMGISSGEKMFPRNTTTELPEFSESPSANVLLVFESTPSLNIRRDFGMFVTARLIKIEPQLVEVEVRGVLGYEDSQAGLKELRAAAGFNIFKGVFSETMVATSLEDAMFRAIDFAQSAAINTEKIYLML